MKIVLALAVSSALLMGGAAVAQKNAVPPDTAAAVADPGRPALDKFRDERRKPVETLVFAGVAQGQVIAELIPGNGYYTRILSKAVGPQGRIYTLPFSEPRATDSRALAADPKYGNVTVLLTASPANLGLPAKVDMVWTTQNYHDVAAGAAALNKAAFDALKPGGIYFIVDHAAVPGTNNPALHRIDEDVVKRQVLAAGFTLEAQSDILRNTADNRRLMVMERELNRATDQFMLRFRKPL